MGTLELFVVSALDLRIDCLPGSWLVYTVAVAVRGKV